MNRRGFLKASLVGALASTPFGKALAALPVTAKLVGTATSSSFSIAVSASSLVKAYVEYGYSKGTIAGKSSVYNISKGSTQSISITNLKPNSLVYYKVKYAVGASKNFSALTQRSVKTASVQAISSSTFAIQADPHMDENSSAAVYEGTLKQIVAASPAFLMDLGDIFMVDKLADKSEANIRSRFELMKGYYQKLGDVPLKICLGNHDGELGYSKFNTKNYRKEYFPEQTGELAYYSFTGPDQLHVVLDPFTYTMKNPSANGWEWTLGKTQYDWLVETLKNSKEKHKFIYIHHLLVGDPQS
ncbi:MAG: metallophosphoesterase family protein, partial [Actinobacteria bacterium]|nr:metallophosphoesterase family protein [Actinomycetota bacterium]